MIWLDNVIAVPLIGLRLEPWRKTSCALIDGINQLLDDYGEFTLEEKGPFGIVILLSNGMSFEINQQDIIIRFKYPELRSDEPGKFPQLSHPDPVPFSKLLEDAQAHLIRIFDSRLFRDDRPLNRIGVVATASIGPVPPPGLVRFVKHMGSPWSGGLLAADARLLCVISKSDSVRDQCHHILKFDEDQRPGHIMLTLDWQRVRLDHTPISTDIIRRETEDCSRSALQYFERFGEGGMQYGNASS